MQKFFVLSTDLMTNAAAREEWERSSNQFADDVQRAGYLAQVSTQFTERLTIVSIAVVEFVSITKSLRHVAEKELYDKIAGVKKRDAAGGLLR